LRDFPSCFQRREGRREEGRKRGREAGREVGRRAELTERSRERRDGLLFESLGPFDSQETGTKVGGGFFYGLVFALFGNKEWDPDRAAYSEILDPRLGRRGKRIGVCG